jgi:hypothetical protein
MVISEGHGRAMGGRPRRHLRAEVKVFEPSPKTDAAGHTLFRKLLVRGKLIE